ncbi:MAG: hypothetical protein RR355_06210, partial [Oscillospiraceae bacterium]
GKEFDWDKNKNALANFKDKIFIAPTSEQLSMVEKYNSLIGKKKKLQTNYLKTIKDSDPTMHSYFSTLKIGIATQNGMVAALNKN